MNREQLLSLKERLIKARLKVAELDKKLTLNCHCSVEDLVVSKTYHSGGYDYRASTTIKTTCSVCGKTKYEEIEHD